MEDEERRLVEDGQRMRGREQLKMRRGRQGENGLMGYTLTSRSIRAVA